jgi:hypothetical protein
MLEKAKNDPSSRDHWKGFGQSLLLQGGFLLVYDIINYVVHSHHGRQLYAAPAKVRLTTTAYGTGLAMNF